MKTLLLMRHGEAYHSFQDPQRPLTDSGKENTLRICSCLKEHLKEVKEIWHSPILRARESAQALKKVMGDVKVSTREMPELKPNGDVKFVASEVNDFFQTQESLFIVGHLPFLPVFASYLLEKDRKQTEIFSVWPTSGCLYLVDHGEGWQVEKLLCADDIES